MTAPRSPADFFALEAGECLNRLERELGHPDALRPDQFVQHARQLRGSALLANQTAIAKAASALERLARAVRDGRQSWDHRTREISLQAVDEFRALVRQTGEWTDSAEAQATELGASLERLGGSSPAAARTSPEPDAGVRAFIAREGALVASALDRAARAIRTGGEWREALQAVMRRMQPLRGLAGVSELAPLPDILEGIELSISELSRPGALETGMDDVVEAAAQALTRVCRDVAEASLPVADSPEAQRFTELLLRTFAAAADGRVGAERPSAPRPGVQLGALELVSHGEHLGQAANDLNSARSRTEHDLRLLALIGSLRVLARAQETASGGLAAFAEAARDAIASGHAREAPAAFAAALRQAGALLRGTSDARDNAAVASAWRQCTLSLTPTVLTPEPARAAAVTPLASDEEVSDSDLVASLSSYHQMFVTRWSEQPSIEGLLGALKQEEPAPTPAPIVDIAPVAAAESLEPEIVPIESLAPDTWGDSGEGLTTAGTEDEIVSIESLAPDAPVEAREDVVPVETLAPDGRVAVVAAAEPDVVPVASLLYRGRSALERAAAVREDLSTQLDARADWSTVRPLVEELLDLVPLALDDA